MEDKVGRLEVPSGYDFSVEVWMVHDNPLWKVSLAGKTTSGEKLRKDIGQNQSYFHTTVSNVPDGNYLLLITATLQDPGARFTLKARSPIDEEAKDLLPVSGKPQRMDALPVLVKGDD